jgi:hypothetical protein
MWDCIRICRQRRPCRLATQTSVKNRSSKGRWPCAIRSMQKSGPDLTKQFGEDGVTTGVAEIAQFAMQPPAAQLRKRPQPLAQIRLKGTQLRYPRLTRTVVRRLQASRASTHCLKVELRPTRDSRYADALAVQRSPQLGPTTHPPKQKRDIIAHPRRGLARILTLRPSAPGEFSTGTSGDYSPGTHRRKPIGAVGR